VATTAAPTEELERSHRVFYYGFVGVLVVCFSPLKVLAYAAPFGFLFWLLSRAPWLMPRNRLIGVIGGTVAVGVFYRLVAPEFLLGNYFLAVITYSAFFPVLIVDARQLASKELMRRMLLLCSAVVLFEGILGIAQAVYGATQTGGFGGWNGDHVEGTIHPQPAPDSTFSNPMFAINMAAMMLAGLCAPDAFGPRKRLRLIIGCVVLVLASVIHVLIFLVAAIACGLLLARTRRTGAIDRTARRNIVLALFIVVGLSYAAMPKELANITNYADMTFDMENLDIPRAIMLYRVYTELPEDAPQQPFIGLGPGQFSSRACMLASGVELGGGGGDRLKAPPLMTPQATYLAKDYGVALMISVAELDRTGYFFGSTQQPFFSLLALYTEIGILGMLVIAFAVGRALWRCRRRLREVPALRLQVLSFSAMTFFFVFLGWQHIYWEVPQVVMVGFLLMKVIYANIMYGPVPETKS
jgi:hypothetical protein